MTVPDLSSGLSESQKINLNVISLNTRVNDLQADVNLLNKVVITGNGELPLREQVRNHDNFIRDIKYWVRFVGGALVLQTIVFLAGIFVTIVKILPALESLTKP